MPPPQETPEVADALEAHVQRLLQSPHFARADTQRKLLAYLYEHRHETVSEYALATDGLGRNSNFDSTTDASVRVHISRLRRKLKDYYLQEPGEPELLVIPTGTHQLMVLEHPAVAARVEAVEAVGNVPEVETRRDFLVPGLVGMVVVLAVLAGWLGWRNHELSGRIRPVPKTSAFWASFLQGTAPIKIILPTPVFFGFPNEPTFRLRSVSVNDFNDIPKDPHFQALVDKLGKPSFEQSYTVTWDTLAAIDMARYLDAVGAQQRISFDVTRDLSPLVLENSNVIAVGTHQTLQPLKEYLQAMNFSLAPSELRVINAKPKPGEQATYEIINKSGKTSNEREVRPSLVALLPGRAPGLKVLLLQSRDTGALVSLLSSSAGSNSMEEMLKKNGNPQYFEMVTYTELENNRPLRTWPVAIHAFASQVPANSM
ncbi:Transcriptional regulatory protein, C terminal [Granulicella pectinivorans]|jgi:hypothetical protein|uniref:Transcriptional regulatory protein, C terminal n=2 Tax=Granulicella pectinivorans TaxID=474950 RepID=A0A1I6M5N8_9BACT|nr:Transcriptional regulatory protein, C terminal [Granulicella pectinivorans]